MEALAAPAAGAEVVVEGSATEAGALPLLLGAEVEAAATGGAGAARTGVGAAAAGADVEGAVVVAAGDAAAAVGDGAGRDGVNCCVCAGFGQAAVGGFAAVAAEAEGYTVGIEEIAEAGTVTGTGVIWGVGFGTTALGSGC